MIWYQNTSLISLADCLTLKFRQYMWHRSVAGQLVVGLWVIVEECSPSVQNIWPRVNLHYRNENEVGRPISGCIVKLCTRLKFLIQCRSTTEDVHQVTARFFLIIIIIIIIMNLLWLQPRKPTCRPITFTLGNNLVSILNTNDKCRGPVFWLNSEKDGRRYDVLSAKRKKSRTMI